MTEIEVSMLYSDFAVCLRRYVLNVFFVDLDATSNVYDNVDSNSRAATVPLLSSVHP